VIKLTVYIIKDLCPSGEVCIWYLQSFIYIKELHFLLIPYP
jgi:hypothetical protein